MTDDTGPTAGVSGAPHPIPEHVKTELARHSFRPNKTNPHIWERGRFGRHITALITPDGTALTLARYERRRLRLHTIDTDHHEFDIELLTAIRS